MEEYMHSVKLDKDKCKGCTNCIKQCPTEAIRVRNGKASIINERCIDCGVCISVCPYHAKIAVTDKFEDIKHYKYSIALPAPSLYGQFEEIASANDVLNVLIRIGFDNIFEVAKGAEIVSQLVKENLENGSNKYPAISSACPTVLRLIQVRFPELLENIIPVNSPVEIAAQLARKEAKQKTGLNDEEIGVFFISPCAAKMTTVKQPLGIKQSYLSGVISIMDIYGYVAEELPFKGEEKPLQTASYKGIGWAKSGGESKAVNNNKQLSVSGIKNVIKALEAIENGKLNNLNFFEGLACEGGCVGGPLTFENVYVASNRIQQMIQQETSKQDEDWCCDDLKRQVEWELSEPIEAKKVMTLDEDFKKAIQMMDEMEAIYEELPMLDCGSCGCPTCRSLAEDIVKGQANKLDCIILLKNKIQTIAGEMSNLS